MSDGAAHIDSESCGQDSGAIEETGKRGVQPTTTGPPPSGQGTENGIAGRTSGNDDLLSRILPHLRVVRGPDTRNEYVCWCPFHADGQGKPPHQPNLYVSIRGFICHACGAKGGLRKLAQDLSIPVAAGNSAFEATYDYHDEKGGLLFQVVRKPGKRFLQRRPDGRGGWIWDVEGVQRVPYRLPEVLEHPDATVYVVEGEKDADRLASLGLTATTNSEGVGKWGDEHTRWLRGHDVVILPDNDERGREHAQQVARSLVPVARSVKVVELPGLPEKGDVFDWLAAGHTVEEMRQLAAEAPRWEQPDEDEETFRSSGGGRRKATHGDRLVKLVVQSGVELFHDEDGTTYARVNVGDHRETWPCRGQQFRTWLAHGFWHSEGRAPSSHTLLAARDVLEAMARFDGAEHPLHNRVASDDGGIWYDLGDPQWRAVRITPAGWEIVAEPPILFRRFAHQDAQVDPVSGKELRRFLDFVNLQDESQGLLLLVYLVTCFVPEIAHPVLLVHGPQGVAKTTLLCMLRRLIDPSSTKTLTFSRNTAELVQRLSHNWAAFFDNVTRIPEWISDALCRAVSGDGFSKRLLYSDDEDMVYHFRRCVGIDSINVVGRKPDLLDRSILLELGAIHRDQRMSEKGLWHKFDQAQPYLFGAVLGTLSRAMGLLPTVQLEELPRMADFAIWGCAIAQALGHMQEEFIDAYDANMALRDEEVLHAHPVAAALVAFMRQPRNNDGWNDTPSRLLEELRKVAEQERIDPNAKAWPKSPHVLTRRLKEVQPNLAAAGIEVQIGRHHGGRWICIRRISEQ